MCIVVKSHKYCWLQRDLRRLLSNARRVQLIDLRLGISRSMAATGTTFCPPKQVQRMRELTDEGKHRFRLAVVFLWFF